MMKDLIQLFKIGKELGLSKKEINRVFLFDDTRYSLFYKILLIISFIFFGIIIIILGIEASRNTYAAGTYYSTIRIKDFKAKNEGIKFK